MKGRSISSPVSQETLVSANKSVIQFPTCRILYRGLVESEFMGRAEFVCLERWRGGGDKVGGGGTINLQAREGSCFKCVVVVVQTIDCALRV